MTCNSFPLASRDGGSAGSMPALLALRGVFLKTHPRSEVCSHPVRHSAVLPVYTRFVSNGEYQPSVRVLGVPCTADHRYLRAYPAHTNNMVHVPRAERWS